MKSELQMAFNDTWVAALITPILDYFDLWLFPTVLVAAWFYYPYCQHGPSLCIWKALFGRPCIGCGLTRGICFLVHALLYDAFKFNPLSIIAVLLMGVAFSEATRDLWQTLWRHDITL